MRIILWVVTLATLVWPEGTWAAGAWRDTVNADGRTTAKVTGNLVKSPFHASAHDWIAAGILATAVGFASGSDKDLRRDALKWDQPWMNTVDDVGHTFQNTGLFFAAAGAFYVGGYAAERPEIRRIGPELVVAFVVAQAGTQIVKHAAGRARPYLNEGPGKFIGPTLKDDHLSFWSGDATTSFVLASVIAEEAGHPAVTALMYTLAATTAFQRIHTDHHWLSDVASAAVWSSAVGINTVRKFKAQNSKLNSDKLSWSISPLQLTVSW